MQLTYAIDEYEDLYFGGSNMTDDLQKRLQQRQTVRLQAAFMVGLAIMIVSFAAYFLSQTEDVQKSYLYPYPYKETVTKYSNKYGMDSALVAAVIKTESRFELDAKSHRGALGLMQLMPDTAKWISSQIEDDNFSFDNIGDPDVNICYGTWYLSTLMREFEGNEVLSLAAYNAGIGNVKSWMIEYGWTYDFRDVNAIPFGETREYVKSVLRTKIKYKALYAQ